MAFSSLPQRGHDGSPLCEENKGGPQSRGLPLEVLLRFRT
jgi:hypothetical protein